jgi:hypothetical protein
MAYGGSGLIIRGMAYGGSGLIIRGMAYGGSDLIITITIHEWIYIIHSYVGYVLYMSNLFPINWGESIN